MVAPNCEKQEKIINGERLLGIPSESAPKVDPVAAPTEIIQSSIPESVSMSGIDNLNIKCLDMIDDLKLKATAKKVFFKSKTAGEDDIVKIDKVVSELKLMDGFSADLEQKLNALKPEAVLTAPAPAVSSESAETESQKSLFNIKLLNEIEDIPVRANLKKIYMRAKKESKNSNEIIPEMIKELESKGLLDDQVKILLEGILK